MPTDVLGMKHVDATGVERNRTRLALWRALSGLRGCLRAEEDALQPCRPVGEVRLAAFAGDGTQQDSGNRSCIEPHCAAATTGLQLRHAAFRHEPLLKSERVLFSEKGGSTTHVASLIFVSAATAQSCRANPNTGLILKI